MSALELAAGEVAERSRIFRSRFATGLAIASIFICVANVVGILAAGVNRPTMLFPAVGMAVSIGALRLVRDGRVRLGTNIVLASDSLLLTAAAVSGGIPELRVVGMQLYLLIVVMGSLFEGFAGGGALLALCAVGGALAPILSGPHAALVVAMQTCALITAWLCGGYAERYFSANERMLADRVREMAVVVDDAERVAEGELAIGEATSQVIRRMLSGLRTLVERSLESVTALAAATAQVSTMSHRQTTSANAQARAVTDARTTLSALNTATESIAVAAHAVLENARAALNAHRAARDHTNALVAREQQVGEFLEMIKDVARRSELLALNAALEGSRAGDAGAAFSLVANEMQQLAENTSDNVTRVKVIVTDIRAATAATAETIGNATELAESTAERARVIETTARAQAAATEEVLAAMDGIATLTQGFAEMSDETLTAMTELTTLASDLEQAVATFRL